MTIENYANQVIKVLERFPAFSSAEFQLTTAKKPGNVTLHGISIRMEQAVVAPVYYVDDFLRNGKSAYDMASSIMDRIAHDTAQAMPIGINMLTDWEQVSKRIVMRLIDARKGHNDEYLLNRVKTKIAPGIAVIYDIVLHEMTSDSATASVPVTRQLMAMWNVTPCQIHDKALENGPKLRPLKFQSLASLMCELMDMPFAPEELDGIPAMDVITNQDTHFGAVAILYPETKGILEKKYPQGFYLLMSSVHEMLVVPNDIPVNCLQDMVMSVNDTEVEQQDQLSDSIYTLDAVGNLIVVEEGR